MRILSYGIACVLLWRHFHSRELALAIFIFALCADYQVYRLIDVIKRAAIALDRIARK